MSACLNTSAGDFTSFLSDDGLFLNLGVLFNSLGLCLD
jgi:hypothetical protein